MRAIVLDRWGSFAEYVALHSADTNLVAMPDGVTAEAAASLGCRFDEAAVLLPAFDTASPAGMTTIDPPRR